MLYGVAAYAFLTLILPLFAIHLIAVRLAAAALPGADAC